MTTYSRRLAFRTLCAVLCAALLLGAPFLGGSQSSARAAQPTPDGQAYYCPYEGGFLAFDWTKSMPYGGWLGVADGFTHKDVQAYDARPLGGGGLNWGFQAQDGSFVCRMYVSSDQQRLDFVNCRPYASWPVTSCFAL
ncbi:MAG TPA: hypothetical protein VF588_18350 [Pyrinomonadaceae bacterium]|jgi:hypothetical protein